MPMKQPPAREAKNERVAPLPAAQVLTAKELAEHLHVHRSTIYRLLKARQLPAFRVGSDWRFKVEAIDAWQLGLPINQLDTGGEGDDE